MKRFRERLLRSARAYGVWYWLGAYLAGLALGRVEWLSPRQGASLFIPPLLLLGLAAFLGNRRLLFAALLISALTVGLARTGEDRLRLERSRDLLRYAGKAPVRLLFRLDDFPDRYPDYTVLWGVVEQLKTDGDWQPIGGRLRLSVGEAAPGVYRGDRILLLAKLSPPRRFRNPGGFDYQSFLERRGVALTGFVESAAAMAVIKEGSPGFQGKLDRLREKYIAWLRERGGEGSGLMAALLAGDRAGLSPESQEVFQETGLAHLLSVSGLHLGLVAAFFFFMAEGASRRWAWLTVRVAAKRTAALFTLFPVIAYAFLTGFSVPTQRALVMTVTYLAAVALDREREVWTAWALAAALVLLFWPAAIYEASFQLSFVSVAGIIWTWPRLMLIFRGIPSVEEMELGRITRLLKPQSPSWLARAGQYLGLTLLIAVVAQITILPLQLEFFHSVNPLAPLFNLVAVPVCGLVLLPVGLMDTLLALVWPALGGAVMTLLSFMAEELISLLAWANRSSETLILLPPLSGPGMVAWYLAGLLFLEGAAALRIGAWSWQHFSPARRRLAFLESLAPLPRKGNRRYPRLVLALSGLLFLSAAIDLGRPRGPFPQDRVVLAALDVGPGQSLLYRSAAGEYVLVDGGGLYRSEWDVGKNVVAPCLLELGVRRLAAVALTHPHPDHAQGLIYVLRHFPVREFWRASDHNEFTAELDRIARERGIPIRVLSEDNGNLRLGTTTVKVLHPPPGPGAFAGNLNNRSLALLLKDRDATVLLVGDIESEVERRLVLRYGPAGSTGADALRARLMSVPHHGSRHSSTEEFIAAVHPEFALVAGGGRGTSLPSPETIERYSRRGIGLGRTDQMGFYAVIVAGDSITLLQNDQLSP